MNDKLNHIENRRVVGGDCFVLIYSRRSNQTLKFYLDKFNLDDYFIFKSTGNQRLLTTEELFKFEFAIYIFFKKDKYDIRNINLWLKWINVNGGVKYLVKPLPPFDPNLNIILK